MFAEKPSLSCIVFRIWLIWLDSFDQNWNSRYYEKGLADQFWQMEGALRRTPLHICQLYRIIRKSPGYDTNLPVTGTGHQISQIKSSYKLFCALIYNLPNFLQNSNFLLFIARFLRHFCAYFNPDNGYFAVTIMKANFDGSSKTSYNVLSHSHIIN